MDRINAPYRSYFFKLVYVPIMGRSLKHLSFRRLREGLTYSFRDIPDRRQTSKIDHSIHDVVMSGFAMMYFQDRSLLQFQERLRTDWGHSNLETLFGVESIPKETQMRTVLDGLDREQFRPAFKNFAHRLQRGKHLEQFQMYDGSYLAVIDGTEYFSSKSLSCAACLEKNHKDGSKTYFHQILQGAIVHPCLRQVIPLMPEEIRNTDGADKQDCEINAGKRFLRQLRRDHPHMKITIGGDGLNSKQPFIEAIRAERMNFILVAKSDDHKIMMEWIGEQRQLGEVKIKRVDDDKGRTHVYEWINKVPLNGNKETTEVNFFSYRILTPDENGKKEVTFKYSWVTDFAVTSNNVEELVRAGRARWKIENECFNTLKNQGYAIEHNYGHGSQNLSFNFLLLTLLAFFCHQIAELTDRLYQECRKKLGSKIELWGNVRAYIKVFVFESWEMLFQFVLSPKSFQPTLIKPG
jgi:hypothetical protein